MAAAVLEPGPKGLCGEAHRRAVHAVRSAGPEREEEGYTFLGARRPADGLSRESRAARLTAKAALCLASLSVVGFLGLRSIAGRSAAASRVLGAGLVGLDLEEGGTSGTRGWYRTYLQTSARRGAGLDSDVVVDLAPGTLVFVAAAEGRRAHILHPVQGWVSMRSPEGLEILRPDISYAHMPGRTDEDIHQAFRSEKMRAATASLREVAVKMNGLEQVLLQRLQDFQEGRVAELMMHQTHDASAAAKSKAPGLGFAAARTAVQTLRQVASPQGQREWLQKLQDQQRLRELAKDVHLRVRDGGAPEAPLVQVPASAARDLEAAGRDVAGKLRGAAHS